MKKRIYENGIEYVPVGDYYFPNIAPPEKKHSVGKYGMLHEEYIKQYRPTFYSRLILTGKLNNYLYEIDKTCHERIEHMIKDMAKYEGITEEMKAKNQLKWVGLMNNIKACAEDIIYSEFVYV